jgi:hypothetical protein
MDVRDGHSTTLKVHRRPPEPGTTLADMTDQGREVEQERDDGLLLDRIDALRVLRADTDEDKSRLLEEIGGHGKPEQDIVDELSKVKPLWRPDRFEEAHRLTMRALEVLDRNGARPAQMPRLGPLTPIAQWCVQQVNRWIVKSHQNTLIERIRKLYERREANCVWGSPEHVMLRRARINAVQVEQGLKGKALGLPTFLLGGAVLSGVGNLMRAVIDSATENTGVLTASIITAVVMLVALGWIVLFAAAVSRRRIRRSVDQPVKALWETIGAAGNPPRDQSYNFAVFALIFLVVAAIVVPAGVGAVIAIAN